MKHRFLLAIVAIIAAVAAAAEVKPGIEVLRERNFDILQGKRVGLITNPTGIDNSLRSTIDILHESPEVNLVALFAPEHGVRGDIVAGQKVTNAVDEATGIKVYSLYGSTRKPTAEMLSDIDVLVYDIQDNGCRSYTFISTMGLAMEQCARLGKEFVVLDRPNPLGGEKVEGPLTQPDCTSFVSQFPIPYIYGLTCGELAGMLSQEKLINTGGATLKLNVVPMKGWHRSMLFADTGMPWVPTSPQIPSAETCIYYPATGIAGELDYLNIGVGYTLPFRTFASTWLNGPKLAYALNALQLPGVAFRPITYKPFFGAQANQPVSGVEVYVTDYKEANLTLIQFYVMQEIAKLHPAKAMSLAASPKRFNMFDKVCGNKAVRTLFTKNYEVADIEQLWNADAKDFAEKTKKYHLY